VGAKKRVGAASCWAFPLQLFRLLFTGFFASSQPRNNGWPIFFFFLSRPIQKEAEIFQQRIQSNSKQLKEMKEKHEITRSTPT
jgi:hypothetical protein